MASDGRRFLGMTQYKCHSELAEESDRVIRILPACITFRRAQRLRSLTLRSGQDRNWSEINRSLTVREESVPNQEQVYIKLLCTPLRFCG